MFNNFKPPQWLGWIAFAVAGLYFVVKLVFLGWWLVYPDTNQRLEPSVGILDIGLGILLFFASAGLRHTGEFTRLAQSIDKRIRNHVTAEHEKTRSLITEEKKQPPVYEDGYPTQVHREADLALLRELWQYINGKDLRRIVEQIDAGTGDYKFYSEKINGYRNFRRNYQERRFNNETLAQTLAMFEDALIRFNSQLSTYADAEPINGTDGTYWIWFPHYKYRLSQELYEYKHREYRKAVDLAYIMLEKHKEFADEIRRRFPNFFDNYKTL